MDTPQKDKLIEPAWRTGEPHICMAPLGDGVLRLNVQAAALWPSGVRETAVWDGEKWLLPAFVVVPMPTKDEP